MMPGLLIIGYGNPLRRDDGFGWHAALRLRESMASRGAEILAVQQLTPELAEPVGRARRVVFLDAAREGCPGDIRRRVLAAAPTGAAFTHSASPEALLAGAARLYGSAPEAVLYTVTGGSFEFGEELTPEVQQAMAAVIAAVEELI
jgi:hydrogenase maturation protease